jgi:hypothetical protein
MKKTSALKFAAALLSLGAVLENVDKTDPKHMIFTFGPKKVESTLPENVNKAIDDVSLDVWEKAWANETLMVNAVHYAEAFDRLKSIVHSS